MENDKFLDMLPLLLFTSLLPIAIGIVLGSTISFVLMATPIFKLFILLNCSFYITIVGVLFVSLHLGKKTKGIYTISGISHSFLSLESIFSLFFGLFLFLVLIVMFFSESSILIAPLLVLSSLCGIMSVISIGKVYDIPSQITWKGIIPFLNPLLGSVIITTIILISKIEKGELKNILPIVLIILLFLDIFFTIVRLHVYRSLKNKKHILTYPQFQRIITPGYLFKTTLLICILGLLLSNNTILILTLFVCVIILDRILFYGSAAKITPKNAISILKAERMKAALRTK